MRGNLIDLPVSWDFPPEDSPLPPESISFVHFLSKKVFNDYEPSQFYPFRNRLIDWLNNLQSERDQQQLLALLLEVFYVGRREFEALYRTAYLGEIFRWIVDVYDIDVFCDNLQPKVVASVDKAWICPISDSLRINAFLKVNNLKSMDRRPDWRSLSQLGDTRKIRAYVKEKKIKELILLEDFVGSGEQAGTAIEFAAKTLPGVKILLCPLIVCPKGDERLFAETEKFENVCYRPVLVLPKSVVHDYEEYKSGRGTEADKFICKVKGNLGYQRDKAMFGFMQTGVKVVLYSNCPNNTLPIFHADSQDWRPLFSRVSRQ